MKHGWEMVPLGEVLVPISREERVQSERQYQVLGAHWYAEGLYTKEQKDGSEIAAEKVYRVEEGDFVYNRLFAWKGSFAIATRENHGCYVSNEFPCFAVERKRLDLQFLRYYFSRESAWTEALGLSSGGTPTSRNRLKEEKLLGMSIPLPPLTEQRRIVAKVEKLAARIEESRHLRRIAAQESLAVSDAASSKAFPAGGESKVGDFVEIQSGYAFKSEWFSDSGIRLVRNVNIGHGRIEWADVARIPEDMSYQFQRFALGVGDILVSLDRPLISTGLKAVRVQDEDLPSLLLQRVGRVMFLRDDVLPDYFYKWLNSRCFTGAIDPGRSNGVPHISPGDITRIPFVPPPLSEQRRIVAYLDDLQAKVDVLKAQQTQSAAELDALLPSILDKAFKGEL